MSIGPDPLTSSNNNSSTNALAGSITTSGKNEVVVLIINTYSGSVHTQVTSIVSASGIVWSLRNSIDTDVIGANDPRIEEWWAPAPNQLIGDSFTIFVNAVAHVSYSQIAIQGCANINNPFDPNPSLPGGIGYPSSTSAASQPMSTTFANTLLLLGYGAGGFGTPSCPAPFTQLVFDKGTYNNTGIAYQVRNSQAANVQGAPNSNASGHLGILSDAFFAPGPLRALATTAGF